ncbi:MAG: DUF4124 domain-containing protein [Halioglobus sp.]|nr:DUF4124 domain-containing protein [Halioglobus sp.]
MNHLRQYPRTLALSLLCCCLPSLAETVYKSVDDSGAVSFSDTRPPGDVLVETVVIETQAPPSSDLTAQRLKEMRETTDRMVADRMAREKHRAELRQLDAQRYAETSSPDLSEYYDTTTSYTGYYPYPVRREWRRPNRPVHPIARPPRPFPVPYRQSDFDYPAKLIRKSYDPKVREAMR